MYISDHGSKLSPNSCFLLTSLNNRIDDRNWPAALQHAVTLMYIHSFLLMLKYEFLDTFSVIIESGLLFTCMSFLSRIKTFPGVSEILIFVTNFSSMLKNVSTVFSFIVWVLVKTGFPQTFPAVSVSSLKLFAISLSLSSLDAVARTAWSKTCFSEHVNMCDGFYDLSSYFKTMFASNWKTEQ